jgi:hypothetical protein
LMDGPVFLCVGYICPEFYGKIPIRIYDIYAGGHIVETCKIQGRILCVCGQG